MTKVSIITPLFNKEPYIRETICSVLAQTLTDWEMIVVENGSTDSGPEIVRQFSDPRIRLVISPKQGPSVARNYGLSQATGEWILFLDADDLIELNYLENTLHIGDKTKANIVTARWRKFTESTAEQTEDERPASEGRTHAELLDSAIVFTPWAIHAAIIRRHALPQELWWPEQMDGSLGEDTAFWFHLLLNTSQWICIPKVGALYRWHTPNCRTQNEDTEKWFTGLHQGACENLRALAKKGYKPTVGQAENLMRLYEELYHLARRTGNHSIEKEALKLAQQWLNYCLRSLRLRPALVGRLLLGFRFFDSIRK